MTDLKRISVANYSGDRVTQPPIHTKSHSETWKAGTLPYTPALHSILLRRFNRENFLGSVHGHGLFRFLAQRLHPLAIITRFDGLDLHTQKLVP